MPDGSSRREFVSFAVAQAGAAWLTAQFPAIARAATHAHHAAQAGARKFEYFNAEHAAEVEAIAAQIIPTDDTPGAREAGVIYFIDRALVTFDADKQPVYKQGLEHLAATVREMFPGSSRFSALPFADQTRVLQALEHSKPGARWRALARSPDFFEVVRAHTIIGFLANPQYGGNRDGIGWKVIGHQSEHSFAPPFGYYDRDYKGQG